MYFEEENILTDQDYTEQIQNPNKKLMFTRNIAFRIYLFTAECDAIFNWYVAEHLMANLEWQTEMLRMANAFRYFRMHDMQSPLPVRSARIQRELSKN